MYIYEIDPPFKIVQGKPFTEKFLLYNNTLKRKLLEPYLEIDEKYQKLLDILLLANKNTYEYRFNFYKTIMENYELFQDGVFTPITPRMIKENPITWKLMAPYLLVKKYAGTIVSVLNGNRTLNALDSFFKSFDLLSPP